MCDYFNVCLSDCKFHQGRDLTYFTLPQPQHLPQSLVLSSINIKLIKKKKKAWGCLDGSVS